MALSRGVVERLTPEHRADRALVDKAWDSPDSRVLVVADGLALADGDRLRLLSPGQAPEGLRIWLGVEGDIAYFAVRPEAGLAADPDAAGLRGIAGLLDAREAGLLTHAVALTNWHATHQFCPSCGAPTEPAAAGHVRVCTREGSEQFPRTDPAMIVLVIDEQERALLGRHARRGGRYFSTLAGFLEPGESLEQAVIREVREEAGVEVEAVAYAGSQPWPFPASLMLGCYARARGVLPTPDGDEVLEVRWFTREELRDETRAGRVLPPAGISIARALVEGWYGGPLPEAGR